jgi:16S rRNA pseudouridine516 synthase
LSPKKHVAKTYYARVVRDMYGSAAEEKSCAIAEGGSETIEGTSTLLVTDKIIEAIRTGVDIGDEKPTAPAQLKVLTQREDEAEIEITITEGRYHQVKRMFQAVGLRVIYLKRLSMGGLVLDDKLKQGEYRILTDTEVKKLKESRQIFDVE